MPLFLFDAMNWRDWRDAIGERGLQIIIIVLVLLAVNQLFRIILRRIMRAAITSAPMRRADDPEGVKRRAETLTSTISWVVSFFLMFVGTALVLDAVGISVTALVAGVGVVGIALGLGAQTLVKDVINGMFILIEDQYRVGDVVSVGNVSGSVIEINPRRTVLRDMNGHVHSVPNGTITIATNMTQGFSRINLDIPLPYDANIERAMDIIGEVCVTFGADRKQDFLDGPKVLRVDAFMDFRVTVKVVGDVLPGKQWELTGELRKRILARLEAEGITLAVDPARAAAVER